MYDYSGFWLNCIAIVTAMFVIAFQYNNEKVAINNKLDILENALTSEFSYYLTEQININNATDKIEIVILTTLFDKSEDAIQFYYDSHFKVEHESKFKPLIDLINVEYLLKTSSPKLLNRHVTFITDKVQKIYENNSKYIKNGNIFLMWSLIATIYLIIVALSYFLQYIDTSKGEPIFNIIDLGLYLSLIEYSGDLSSPIILFLAMSLVVAIFEFTTIFTKDKYRASVSKGSLYSIGPFVPSILYVFVLITGLVWSSIDSFMTFDIGFKMYLYQLFQCFGKISVLGAIGFTVLFLFYKNLVHPSSQV